MRAPGLFFQRISGRQFTTCAVEARGLQRAEGVTAANRVLLQSSVLAEAGIKGSDLYGIFARRQGVSTSRTSEKTAQRTPGQQPVKLPPGLRRSADHL